MLALMYRECASYAWDTRYILLIHWIIGIEFILFIIISVYHLREIIYLNNISKIRKVLEKPKSYPFIVEVQILSWSISQR